MANAISAKGARPRSACARRATNTCRRGGWATGPLSHCGAARFPGRKIVDAAETGDEARIARRDAPERKIGQLEVDRLLRKALEPRVLERRVALQVLRLAANGHARERERIGAAVVGL